MTKVVLNKRGFAALRSTPKVMAVLNQEAHRIAGAAGPGFEVQAMEVTAGASGGGGSHRRGPNAWQKRGAPEYGGRARVAVITTSFEAMLEEAKNRTLTRAVGR